VEEATNWTFGSGGFAKLYGDRLAQSSLLDRAVATRWVFVFMLSQADAQGRYRCASISGLARAAAVTNGEAELAVKELEAPDPQSTTKAQEGRRILRIPGGWQIVAYERYREYRTERQLWEAERKRKQRRDNVGHVQDVPRTSGGVGLRRQRPDPRYKSPDDAPATASRPPDDTRPSASMGGGLPVAPQSGSIPVAKAMDVLAPGEWPPTWVDLLVQAVSEYGVLEPGKVGKLLLPLRGRFPLEAVEAALERYAQAGRLRFGLTAFVETVGEWLCSDSDCQRLSEKARSRLDGMRAAIEGGLKGR
jgi:hypothetical protein